MGPIEQEMVNGYSSLSARMKSLRPPNKKVIVENTGVLQQQINVISVDIINLKKQLKSLSDQIHEASKQFKAPQSKSYAQPVHRIIELVSQKELISELDLKSHRRTRVVCMARQICYFLSVTTTLYSLPQIGRVFGNRNHTTILSGKRNVERQRKDNSTFDERIKWYEEQLKDLPYGTPEPSVTK